MTHGLKVIDPDQHVWVVRRRWLRWRPRWWGSRPRGQDLEALFAIDFGDVWWISAVLLGLLGLVFVVFFVLPALVFVLQLLIFAVLLALGLVGRVLFRRPWIVEVSRLGSKKVEKRWQVVGWRRSGRVIREVAEAIELGQRDIAPDEADPLPLQDPR